jgi:hypothetical protein
MAALAGCSPITGEARLWADPRTNYVIVGETHGTSEIPAFFGDLACSAHASGRPIVVAVEAADTEQGAIDRFLSSDGGEAAQRAFLHSAIWNSPMKDGRSSRAYFDLIMRLRNYKRSGLIADVVAIQPVKENVDRGASQTAYNALMAKNIRAARALHPNALLLVLVGNVHASKGVLKFGAESLVPAAADLPPEETISLDVVTGGEAWNCYGPSACGPHRWSGNRPEKRAVWLDQRALPRFDGGIDLGVPTTASPPVAPDRLGG